MLKNPPAMQETWVQSLGPEIPCRREWLPTPVFLPGEFHGQRSLVSYSPWGQRVRQDQAINTHIRSYKLLYKWIGVLGGRKKIAAMGT